VAPLLWALRGLGAEGPGAVVLAGQAAGLLFSSLNVVLLAGLLDALYWGEPFSSLRAFLSVWRGAVQDQEWPRGEQPFWWYLTELRTFLSAAALLLFWLAHLRLAERARPMLLWF
jgi:hypothetical protein